MNSEWHACNISILGLVAIEHLENSDSSSQVAITPTKIYPSVAMHMIIRLSLCHILDTLRISFSHQMSVFFLHFRRYIAGWNWTLYVIHVPAQRKAPSGGSTIRPRRLHLQRKTSKEYGMVLVSILSIPMQSLPSSPNISEVHYYPPPPLNLLSSSKHHTTTETSTSRPSMLLLFIHSNSISSTDTSIILLRRLAHRGEAAITRADIESIEKQGIRCRYAGSRLRLQERNSGVISEHDTSVQLHPLAHDIMSSFLIFLAQYMLLATATSYPNAVLLLLLCALLLWFEHVWPFAFLFLLFLFVCLWSVYLTCCLEANGLWPHESETRHSTLLKKEKETKQETK